MSINVENTDGLSYLSSIENNSIDLILTDPPYIISQDSGMDKHYNTVKENEEKGIKYVKTEEEWLEYKNDNNLISKTGELETQKENYLRYGTIYGKKYCVRTDYGEWDKNFTMDDMDAFIGEYYKKLKKGGTMKYDSNWKINHLKGR